MIPRTSGTVVALGALALSAAGVDGQIRSSERGWVGQRVDGTNITVDYARPQSRGRANLFGGVVHTGEIWTPGANWATTFSADKDIIIEGQTVEAGTYSVWLVSDESDSWTLHLDDESERFHTDRPGLDEMAVSIPVSPEVAEHHESLTFHFPEFRRDGTTLHFHWGDTQVAMDIEVLPSATGTLAADQLAKYVGMYDLEMLGEGEPLHFSLEAIDANGKLRAIIDDGDWAFEFVPDAEQENTFYFAFLVDGEVVDIEEGPIHFNFEDGEVVGFTVLGIGIDVWMEAVKR